MNAVEQPRDLACVLTSYIKHHLKIRRKSSPFKDRIILKFFTVHVCTKCNICNKLKGYLESTSEFRKINNIAF